MLRSYSKSKLETALDTELSKLLEDFSTVIRDDLPAGLPSKTDVDHKLKVGPDSKSPHISMFQLSPTELNPQKNYISDLLRTKKNRPSRSPYDAPLFFVKKKGKLRGVIDYRTLNRITKSDHAPLHRNDEVFDQFGQAKYFSKLVLKIAFHHILICPEDIEKTVFMTKYGLFEFLVMPMGPRNAPVTFQSLMNSTVYDYINDLIAIHADDIFVLCNKKGAYHTPTYGASKTT